MQTLQKMTGLSILAVVSFLATASDLVAQGMVETCGQMNLSLVPRWTPPPWELVLAVPEDPPERSIDAGLDAEARQAAAWTARRLAGEGRRQARRLGFYVGLHAAIEDADMERRAYRWGLDRGRRSSEARRTGARLGDEAAKQDDLRSDRRPGRRGGHPEIEEAALARLEKQAPDLEQVLREYPLTDVLLIMLFDIRFLADPWPLYQARDRGEVYDDGWQEASRALLEWLDENPQDGPRRDFLELFIYHYPRELVSALGDDLLAAYAEGLIDGWRYGVIVQSASSCRRGFVRGWNETMRSGARAAFRHGLRRRPSAQGPLSSLHRPPERSARVTPRASTPPS